LAAVEGEGASVVRAPFLLDLTEHSLSTILEAESRSWATSAEEARQGTGKAMNKAMKRGFMKNVFLVTLLLAGTVLLSHCGNKGGGGGAQPPPPVVVDGSQGGCVTTSGGCLPQGSCPANYGMSGVLPNATCLKSEGPNGLCAVGMIKTQFGCLAQGPCPVGSASYGNTCVPRLGAVYR
jgi:hypothetical protein